MASKHGLHTRWALALRDPQRARARRASWREGLVSLPHFGCVEDFWALHDQLAPPSALGSGCDYFLFREGSLPSWEAYPAGGAWKLTLPHRQLTKGGYALDQLWLGIALAVLGEQLLTDELKGGFEEICGAVVSVRVSGDRISIWTRSSLNESLQKYIGNHIILALSCAIGLPSLPADLIYTAHGSRVSKSVGGDEDAVLYRITPTDFRESRTAAQTQTSMSHVHGGIPESLALVPGDGVK